MKVSQLKFILLTGFFLLVTVALLPKTKHEARMEKISLLQAEAFDDDTSKFEVTQKSIHLLLKRIDKEYSITDDFDTKILLIEERESLKFAEVGNSVKGYLILEERIRKELKSDVERFEDLPIEPGRSGETEKINLIHNSENKGFVDLHEDPGRNG
jgi:hypothetical protein